MENPTVKNTVLPICLGRPVLRPRVINGSNEDASVTTINNTNDLICRVVLQEVIVIAFRSVSTTTKTVLETGPNVPDNVVGELTPKTRR